VAFCPRWASETPNARAFVGGTRAASRVARPMTPPLFPEWSNTVFWALIALGILSVLAAPTCAIVWARSPYSTAELSAPVQPVKFDHRHHVRDDGIDCLYCHPGARQSAYAGVPATSVCMNCHGQVWNGSPELARVRDAYFSGKSIAWERVNALPDFVFFNHAVHVNKGVGCVTCHGRVDEMAQVTQAEPLTMRWCLDCHRNPEPNLRPVSAVTDMEWKPGPSQKEMGHELGKSLGIRNLDDCTVCHR
jgi:hypothetical protein